MTHLRGFSFFHRQDKSAEKKSFSSVVIINLENEGAGGNVDTHSLTSTQTHTHTLSFSNSVRLSESLFDVPICCYISFRFSSFSTRIKEDDDEELNETRS